MSDKSSNKQAAQGPRSLALEKLRELLAKSKTTESALEADLHLARARSGAFENAIEEIAGLEDRSASLAVAVARDLLPDRANKRFIIRRTTDGHLVAFWRGGMQWGDEPVPLVGAPALKMELDAARAICSLLISTRAPNVAHQILDGDTFAEVGWS